MVMKKLTLVAFLVSSMVFGTQLDEHGNIIIVHYPITPSPKDALVKASVQTFLLKKKLVLPIKKR